MRRGKKSYCTQNDGKCESCSLVNYGRDCFNQPIRPGGKDPETRRNNGRMKSDGIDAAEGERWVR